MKCNLNDCLINDQSGECTLDLKLLINQSSPNNKTCKYYSNDLKKDIIELKSKGGISGIINNKGKVVKEEIGAPRSTSKEGIKVSHDYNGYTINRLNDRSYEILKDGKKFPAKHLFIQFICELNKTQNKTGLLKKGTRPLGNMFLRLVGINL
jgi:hypothetical protein